MCFGNSYCDGLVYLILILLYTVTMKTEYIDFFTNILKLEILEPDKSSAEKVDIRCLICSSKFNATPKSKLSNFKKYNNVGCPKCFSSRLKKSFAEKRSQKLNANYIKIGNISDSILIVKLKKCNHILTASLTNLLYERIQCHVCNHETYDEYSQLLDLRSIDFNHFMVEKTNLYINDYNKIVVMVFNISDITQQKVGKKYVRNFKIKYEKFGYRVIQFFNDEIIDKPNLIFNKIKHISNKSDVIKIYARKCIIKEVSPKEKNIFLNKFHIQGNAPASIIYGLYFNEELVALMTFSNPRILMNKKDIGNKQYWELSRYATDDKYQVLGGASKLLSYFKNNNSWKYIYSFADARWSLGNLYEKTGFVLEHTNKPEYYYIVNGKHKHRWGFRKHAIKDNYPESYDNNLTEYENMQKLNIDRIWDSGMMKYGLRK